MNGGRLFSTFELYGSLVAGTYTSRYELYRHEERTVHGLGVHMTDRVNVKDSMKHIARVLSRVECSNGAGKE